MTDTEVVVKTLKFRVKDRHVKRLNEMAKSVNFVWNYINELSHRAIRERGLFLSGYDFQKYTGGTSKDLGLRSSTIQMIGHEYATRRRQFKKSKLRWRKSHGSRRSLGWIPCSGSSVKFKNGKIAHNGILFGFWAGGYNLADYKLGNGSFNEDARGRWYFNVTVKVPTQKSIGTSSLGIDLGCKEAATDSNGDGVTGREYRRLENDLAVAQRANKKKRVKAIHAKIRNRRHDSLHKYSRKVVNENAAIFVGDVSSQKLVKTKMAKSVLDAGWSTLKTMLEYKCNHAGVIFEEVNESYTTQTCSSCGALPPERPKGIAGLGIREWTCSECGVTHDRDINAARNILAAGHSRLEEGSA